MPSTEVPAVQPDHPAPRHWDCCNNFKFLDDGDDWVCPKCRKLTNALVIEETQQVRGDLSRTDTKAQTLLTLATALIAVVASLATTTDPAPLASVLLWTSAVPATASVWTVIQVITPRTIAPLWHDLGTAADGWSDHVLLVRTAIPDVDQWRASHLAALSRLLGLKFVRLRTASWLLTGALALLLAAGATAALTS